MNFCYDAQEGCQLRSLVDAQQRASNTGTVRCGIESHCGFRGTASQIGKTIGSVFTRECLLTIAGDDLPEDASTRALADIWQCLFQVLL